MELIGKKRLGLFTTKETVDSKGEEEEQEEEEENKKNLKNFQDN